MCSTWEKAVVISKIHEEKERLIFIGNCRWENFEVFKESRFCICPKKNVHIQVIEITLKEILDTPKKIIDIAAFI